MHCCSVENLNICGDVPLFLIYLFIVHYTVIGMDELYTFILHDDLMMCTRSGMMLDLSRLAGYFMRVELCFKDQSQ